MSDDEKDGLQFDQAEFEPGQAGAPSACAVCAKALEGSYYTLNGHPSCEACKTGFEARFTGGSGFARLSKSVVFGILGGLIGAAVYYGVAKITGYELSLIAIATGWLTGKGVSIGNGQRGGKRYQVLAVLLTWGAISASFVPFLDEAMRDELTVPVEQAAGESEPSSPADPAAEGEGAAPAEPAAQDGSGFFDLPTPLRWAIEFPLAVALPFLSITESPMGLIILLIGLWTAWGTNKKIQLHVSGPHALQAPTAPVAGEAGPADPMPPSA